MGLMTKLFGGKIETVGGEIQATQCGIQAANQPTHGITKQAVLGNTDPNVPSPHNAKFDSIRTAPVLQKPRYFSKAEADALAIAASEKREMAEHARKAYKSLKSIDSSDVEVHQIHRTYQGKLSQNELQKLQANTRLAEQLHSQRPEYGRLGARVDSADQNASNAIAAIKNSYGV